LEGQSTNLPSFNWTRKLTNFIFKKLQGNILPFGPECQYQYYWLWLFYIKYTLWHTKLGLLLLRIGSTYSFMVCIELLTKDSSTTSYISFAYFVCCVSSLWQVVSTHLLSEKQQKFLLNACFMLNWATIVG